MDTFEASNFTHRRACRTIQEVFPDKVDEYEFRIVLSISYWAIFAFGFASNATVLVLILRHSVAKMLHGVYIASLTVSTLLLALTSLPITAVQIFTRTWPLGPVSCKLIPFLQATNVFAISLTLCAIAMDRYTLIVKPFKSAICRPVPVTISLWGLSAFLASPYAICLHAFVYTDDQGDSICGLICDEQWPNQRLRQSFSVIVLCTQFGGPVVFFIYCYGMISREVRRQVNRRLTNFISLPRTQSLLQQRRTQVNKMITMLILSFVLPWCPLHLLSTARDFSLLNALVPEAWSAVSVAIAHCLAMTTCIWNPITYGYYHPDIRRYVGEHIFRRVLPGSNNENAVSPCLNSKQKLVLISSMRDTDGAVNGVAAYVNETDSLL